MLRVLVCGSRTFAHYPGHNASLQERQTYQREKEFLYNVLYEFCAKRGLESERDQYGNYLPQGLIIVHGGAKGADRTADEWAVVNWVPVEEYPADWDKHGRAAGPIRNQQMLDTGIDVVIAFPKGEARGTKHMMKIARTAGVEVIEAL